MVIHGPRASTHIPDGLHSQFVLNDAELTRELGHITDRFTGADCTAELLRIANGLGYRLRADGEDLVVVPPDESQMSSSSAAMLTHWKPVPLVLLTSECNTMRGSAERCDMQE